MPSVAEQTQTKPMTGPGDSLLVNVENVEKVFRRGSEEIHVLSNLNLKVPKGEFLALMGAGVE